CCPNCRTEPADPSSRSNLRTSTALALGEAKSGVLSHIQDGGVWIYPILFLAAVALLSAILKWFQIAPIRDLKPTMVSQVLQALHSGSMEDTENALGKIRHPARALLARGVEMSGQSKEVIEEAMYEKFIEAQPTLQRGLAFLAITSATAPLLGLLGTVTGMIQTFELINIFGTGDARSLASGISEALVTTEFGLIVAIPALILHALLSRRVKGILGSMEMASLAFVNGLERRKEGVA
ncbi:MAG: MotA/TolQ/ExbB proton channel family protein, partial [Verrucomicrobiota bacterium]